MILIQLTIAFFAFYNVPPTFSERFEPALHEPLIQVRFTIHAHDVVRGAECSWLQGCQIT
jgi:hypothetical protein